MNDTGYLITNNDIKELKVLDGEGNVLEIIPTGETRVIRMPKERNKYEIAREVWEEYNGYEELFGEYLDEKLGVQEQA